MMVALIGGSMPGLLNGKDWLISLLD